MEKLSEETKKARQELIDGGADEGAIDAYADNSKMMRNLRKIWQKISGL